MQNNVVETLTLPFISPPSAQAETSLQNNVVETWTPPFDQAYEDFWNFHDIYQEAIGDTGDILGSIERDQWYNASL